MEYLVCALGLYDKEASEASLSLSILLICKGNVVFSGGTLPHDNKGIFSNLNLGI